MKKYRELSYPQKSIMLTENFYKNTNVNNICGTAIIKNKVNFDYLREAVNIVTKSNQNFWIRFCRTKDGLKQYTVEPRKLDVKIIDIEDEFDIETLEKKMTQRVFKIEDSELFEIVIFRDKKKSGGFILNIHHFVSDSWTLGLFCREMMDTYAKLCRKDNPEFEEKYDYFDFLEREKEYRESEKYNKDKEFWEQALSREINPAILPSDVFNDNSSLSSIGERLKFSISKNKMKLITHFCAQNKVSVYNFLISIYSLYISKIINSNHFSIGTPILNRTNYKEKNTMGMFINIIPLFFDINKSLSFLDYVIETSQKTVSMLRHQKYPYQLMLEKLRKNDSTVPNLYNIVLSYQITKTNDGSEYDYKTRWAFNGTVADDLTIQFLDLQDDEKLDVMYDFKRLKFSRDYIRNIHSRILEMINQVIENPKIELSDIEITSKYEQEKILHKFNNTEVAYNKSNNVIRQFKSMVKKHPKKVAVIANGRKYTYEELDVKSTLLANYLIKNGVNRRDIVGIMINRSLELCVRSSCNS